jgi:hypothetical protein
MLPGAWLFACSIAIVNADIRGATQVTSTSDVNRATMAKPSASHDTNNCRLGKKVWLITDHVCASRVPVGMDNSAHPWQPLLVSTCNRRTGWRYRLIYMN